MHSRPTIDTSYTHAIWTSAFPRLETCLLVFYSFFFGSPCDTLNAYVHGTRSSAGFLDDLSVTPRPFNHAPFERTSSSDISRMCTPTLCTLFLDTFMTRGKLWLRKKSATGLREKRDRFGTYDNTSECHVSEYP